MNADLRLFAFIRGLKIAVRARDAFTLQSSAKDSATCGGFDVADPARVIVPPQWQN